MRYKFSKVIKDLNVGEQTIRDFLKKKGIDVDSSINAKINEDVYGLLVKEFKPDMEQRLKSESFTSERQKEKAKISAETVAAKKEEEAARKTETIKAEDSFQKYTVIGKLDKRTGKIITGNEPKPAQNEATTPAPAAPAAPAQPKPQPAEAAAEAPVAPAPAKEPEKPVASEDKPKPAAEQAANQPTSTTAQVSTPVAAPQPKPEAPKQPEAAKPQQPEAAAKPAQQPGKDKSQQPQQPKANGSKQQRPQQQQPKPANAVGNDAAKNAAGKQPQQKQQQQPKQAQTPAAAPAAQQPATAAKPANKPDIFEYGHTQLKTNIKVVTQIDLDAINDRTRPRRKSKEERRNERQKAAGQAGANGQRKKRKRIGGPEKIDIEKSAMQMQNGRGNAQDNRNNGGNGGRGRRKDNRGKRNAAFKPDVDEEDVQRQVKETLARLTTKKQKNAVKYRREKREAVREEEREEAAKKAAEKKVLKLTEFVTVNDLASMMNVPVNKVIATCMNLGLMVSINQRLDAETINVVADEFGFKTEYASAEVVDAIQEEEDKPEDLVQRPPVVTVMGHVDHGKTSLLDYIRKSNVIAGEAGGITQHIGAYNVKLSNGRRITFLDTPGHEAFTAMRARGAKVTDVVIVIVAADDGVKPQTVEALNHATAAGVPIVFAINKIDKPGANPDLIKEELANMNYLVEDWGGKYQSQDISAKKGIGVPELMDKVLLEADMLDLKANPNRKATGSIIESSLDKGRGYVATVLVDNGTLHVGDVVLAGTHYGKVKAMFNERNQRITDAGPSTPALILGLNGAPTAGDKFNVMDTDQEARQIANKREQLQRELGLRTQKRVTLEDIARRRALGEFHELNIIVKGDVDGSIEALSDSLEKLSTPEVKVNVIHKAVGAITESDVTLAAASDAYIVGFQVRPSADAKRLAQQEGVDIRIYSIIYDVIDDVKNAMEGMLKPEIKEEVCGSLEVKEVYHISKVGTIAGAIVKEGKVKRTNKVRLIRDGIVRHTGTLGSLKRFKDDVKEVGTNMECGVSITGYNDIAVGDIIEAFDEIEVQKGL